jgi:glutathione S-transferase
MTTTTAITTKHQQLSVLHLGKTAIEEDIKASLHDSVSYLDIFLESSPWVAGSNMTIADCSCVTSVSTIVVSSYRCYLGIAYGRVEKQQQESEQNRMSSYTICTCQQMSLRR